MFLKYPPAPKHTSSSEDEEAMLTEGVTLLVSPASPSPDASLPPLSLPEVAGELLAVQLAAAGDDVEEGWSI